LHEKGPSLSKGGLFYVSAFWNVDFVGLTRWATVCSGLTRKTVSAAAARIDHPEKEQPDAAQYKRIRIA